MSRRTDREHVGNPGLEYGLESEWSAGQDAADDLVGDFGRRDVENALNQPGLDELLHRLAAGAGRVKNQAIEAAGFQCFPNRRHARRCDAEHGHAERRFFVDVLGLVLDHPGHGSRGVAEHAARDGVDPGDVDDRRHDRDIARADVRGRVAAGDGRDHELGHSDGQTRAWRA